MPIQNSYKQGCNNAHNEFRQDYGLQQCPYNRMSQNYFRIGYALWNIEDTDNL